MPVAVPHSSQILYPESIVKNSVFEQFEHLDIVEPTVPP